MTTVNGGVGYDVDLDDDHNGMGDMGESGRERDLPMLSADAISLALDGEGGQEGNNTFSSVIARQQALEIRAIWDFLRDHKPDEKEGRVVLQQTASAVIYLLSSDALQTIRRRDDLKEQEKEILKEVSKELKEQAEGYFSSWSKGNSMQQYIACYHHRHGWEALERREPEYREDGDGNPLPVISGPRYDWYKAAWDMEEADREAILELPAKAYDLFYTWQQMSLLARDENENRARNLPDLDMSKWLERVKSGNAKTAEIVLGAGWLFQELVTFALSHEGENNPHVQNLIKLFRGASEHARRRPNSWWGRRSMREGGEGE